MVNNINCKIKISIHIFITRYFRHKYTCQIVKHWDRVQTHESLKRYLLEETFELFEAIDNEDDWHMILAFKLSITSLISIYPSFLPILA
jgi:uncharacterized protein YabN with tetrapyrrole methylase and pyrophosphatase domain